MSAPSLSLLPIKIAGLLAPVKEICTNLVPTAFNPSAKNVGLKAIEIGSPVNKISIASVACASTPTI